MKNLSHVMKDLKMTNKLKIYVCALVEKIWKYYLSVAWAGFLIAH